jgi:hypothetical protein
MIGLLGYEGSDLRHTTNFSWDSRKPHKVSVWVRMGRSRNVYKIVIGKGWKSRGIMGIYCGDTRWMNQQYDGL